MTHTKHRMMTIALAVSVSLSMAPSALAARGGSERLTGDWGGAVPCVPTAVDTSSNQVSCVGSTTWAGSLTGQTHYTFDGTTDLVTGAGEGTIDETFVGWDEQGRVGTLRFSETIASVPSGIPNTGYVRIEARVVDGSGGFEGARGRLVFVGTVSTVGAIGTYSGRISLGAT